LAKVYLKTNGLPNEQSMLSGVIKKQNASFYEIKGLLEQLLADLGIKNIIFKNSEKAGLGASLYLNKEYLGEIEVLDNNLVDFEINFDLVLEFANLKREYKALNKYPPLIEDISVITKDDVKTEDIITQIKKQSELIVDVSFFDKFQDSRTFRIVYQDQEKNLTSEDVVSVRKRVITSLETTFNATIK
jgi:phenylalanyl-tRNA synthetase beta chain